MVAATAEDWAGVEAALSDLAGRIGTMRTAAAGAAAPPSVTMPGSLAFPDALDEESMVRRRKPSVFSAPSESDIKLLGRCYTPNIFAWDRLCDVGVEDDVDDLQLRVGHRLRLREEALKAKDLAALKALQAEEMRDADSFMQAFDVQQWMQHQGPLPLSSQGSPALSAPARASSSSATCRRSGAGPLPARKQDTPSLSQWPSMRPLGRPGFDCSDELLGARVSLDAGAICPSCGSNYAPDALYCRRCGQKRMDAGSGFLGPRQERRPRPPNWSPALADVLSAGGWVPPAAWPHA
eukprot:TRINITY_DN14366_c0_g1_i2.p1 TRINITY_DN14366_c0_g1~~TRINITY_DN14366_c0_g1_i2.p1  ORF type:complete len:312 (-),score=66.74 TRINITY_DN14366_c0_g1_i2:74-955(-)